MSTTVTLTWGELLDDIERSHVRKGKVVIIRTNPFLESTPAEIRACVREMKDLVLGLVEVSPLQRLAIDLLRQSAGHEV